MAGEIRAIATLGIIAALGYIALKPRPARLVLPPPPKPMAPDDLAVFLAGRGSTVELSSVGGEEAMLITGNEQGFPDAAIVVGGPTGTEYMAFCRVYVPSDNQGPDHAFLRIMYNMRGQSSPYFTPLPRSGTWTRMFMRWTPPADRGITSNEIVFTTRLSLNGPSNKVYVRDLYVWMGRWNTNFSP